MRFPTVDDVIGAHNAILAATGGTPGILNVGSIDSALYRAQWGPFLGVPSLQHRAALLLRGLCQDHPFVDGNKRTSIAVTVAFLEWNALKFTADPGQLVEFALAVAQDELSVRAIAGWLTQHTRNVKQGAD